LNHDVAVITTLERFKTCNATCYQRVCASVLSSGF